MAETTLNAAHLINATRAKAFSPRKTLTVSEWADNERRLSKKGSAEPGPWRTERNPPLREPMDCLSARSTVHDVVLMFPIQFGKALALNTPIPTTEGWANMGDLKAGDWVLGADGNPVKVLIASDIFTGHDCYKITFSDGETIVADAGHRWFLIDTLARNEARKELKRRLKVKSPARNRKHCDGSNAAHAVIKTTEQIADTFLARGKQSRYAVHVAKAIELPEQLLPIDPYLLGVWLGDGSAINCGLTLFEDDAEHILERIHIAGHSCKVTPDNDQKSVSVRVEKLHALLSKTGLKGFKYIPCQYLRASRLQRLALLQGLLDTDGHAMPSGHVEICSSYPELAAGIIELIQSLGFKPTHRIKKTTNKDSTRITFTAYFGSDVFSLPRKSQVLPPPGPRADDIAGHRFIINVERVDTVPTRCIAVDNADHLFLCGRGFIPTHNTEVAVNALGYIMDHSQGPVMVCLPGEVSQSKWINQKLNPMIEETPAVQKTLITSNSRNSANTKDFKDFIGGQLYIEHAGSPARLKSTTVKYLIVDELTEFAGNLNTGDDPLMMLEDRTSAFPATYKRLYISSPGIKGVCRTEELYQKSDQRKYHVPCPHCEELIIFEWSGLHWSAGGQDVRYVCPECACEIEEHYKTDMIKKGRWIATNPGPALRGYQINALYYQVGLGPRWATLVDMWLQAYNDPARLKTFLNSRLAEAWEDPTMRAVKMNVIADRAETYRLRVAPLGVAAITAGVDTQDNRLAVHITGWGKNMASWTLDYVELMGDPADEPVWVALIELLNTPIQHVNGHLMPVMATAIDAGGHRTEAVKDFVRRRLIRRPMVIFGAVNNNAPVLSKPKAQDVNWRGNYNKRGVHIQHVGTVAVKNVLFGRLATDGDKDINNRLVHFSEDLPSDYFTGITSETYDPRSNRFVKKRGARNEPLDTWVYAYAAAHHQELRLHLHTQAKWNELLAQYGEVTGDQFSRLQVPEAIKIEIPAQPAQQTQKTKPISPLTSDSWSSRL